MGNFLLLIALTSLGTLNALAAGDEPAFELINKHNKPIWVTLRTAPSFGAGLGKTEPIANAKKKLASGDSMIVANNIDLNMPLWVTIDLDEKTANIANPLNHHFAYAFPNTAGKTKYVTFNPTKNKNDRKKWIYPQTGTMMGILGSWGKTASGYSLGKNISDEQINRIMIYEGPLP